MNQLKGIEMARRMSQSEWMKRNADEAGLRLLRLQHKTMATLTPPREVDNWDIDECIIIDAAKFEAYDEERRWLLLP